MSNLKEYIVQPGDTLSSIAQTYSGRGSNYLTLAGLNNIEDPNLIHVGQRLMIPEKFDKPLKKSEIPTKNRLHIIDNYSPNFNYIVEGDKVYYSKKGRDYWVDISDNNKARQNLLGFLKQKYNFKGYEDGESDIYDKILNNGWTYQNRNQLDQKTPGLNEDLFSKNFIYQGQISPQLQEYIKNLEQSYKAKPQESPEVSGSQKSVNKSEKKIINDQDQSSGFFQEYSLKNLRDKAKNWIDRHWRDEDAVTVNTPEDNIDLSGTRIRTIGSITGDTIQMGSSNNRYFLPENLDLNEFTFGVRNRGDYTPINTEAASIPLFKKFTQAKDIEGPQNETYIGVTASGQIKAGPLSIFSPEDWVSKTFSNNIIGFKRTSDGNIQYKNDSAHGNPRHVVPITIVQNGDGTTVEGSLNILAPEKYSGDRGDRFGNVSGGRILVDTGNGLRLISGSINQIVSQFEKLKEELNKPYLTVFTLDNGSYNRGLRTKNQYLSKEDLKFYDNQNHGGGGNFIYIKERNQQIPQFASDTILTPNIRTETSESYLNGHPLTNEVNGVVLHHTGFTGNVQDAINHMVNPKTEVSAHVVIDYDGSRTVLASPNQVTFHSGQSMFNGRLNVNDFLLGIEFQGDTNKKDLTDAQIDSVVEYLTPIILKYNIPLNNITTHEQVRKNYNEYAAQSGLNSAPYKPDINQKNYNRIMKKLLDTVYYTTTNRDESYKNGYVNTPLPEVNSVRSPYGTFDIYRHHDTANYGEAYSPTIRRDAGIFMPTSIPNVYRYQSGSEPNPGYFIYDPVIKNYRFSYTLPTNILLNSF